VERLPATIGRAYTNDVILDDRHVDPQHARLTVDEQGALVLEDLGSVNGLYEGGGTARLLRCSVKGAATVRLGHTNLRIVAAGHPVPPAVPEARHDERIARLVLTARGAAVTLALGLALATLSLWLSDTGRSSAVRVAGEAAGLLALTAVWAGIWAFAGRVNVQRFSFMPHLAATWLFAIALGVVGVALDYADFLLPAAGVVGAARALAVAALLWALLVAHFALATAMGRGRRRLVAGVTVLALLAFAVVLTEAAPRELEGHHVRITASLKPVPASLVPASRMERFVSRTDALRRTLDRLAEKK
jgi:hypothetical protein